MDCHRCISLSVLMSHNYYFMSSLTPKRAAAENVGNDGSAERVEKSEIICSMCIRSHSFTVVLCE